MLPFTMNAMIASSVTVAGVIDTARQPTVRGNEELRCQQKLQPTWRFFCIIAHALCELISLWRRPSSLGVIHMVFFDLTSGRLI